MEQGREMLKRRVCFCVCSVFSISSLQRRRCNCKKLTMVMPVAR